LFSFGTGFAFSGLWNYWGVIEDSGFPADLVLQFYGTALSRI